MSLGTKSPVPSWCGLTSLQKVIAAQVLLDLYRSDPAAALEGIEAIWQVARSLAARPELLSQLMAMVQARLAVGAAAQGARAGVRLGNALAGGGVSAGIPRGLPERRVAVRGSPRHGGRRRNGRAHLPAIRGRSRRKEPVRVDDCRSAARLERRDQRRYRSERDRPHELFGLDHPDADALVPAPLRFRAHGADPGRPGRARGLARGRVAVAPAGSRIPRLSGTLLRLWRAPAG